MNEMFDVHFQHTVPEVHVFFEVVYNKDQKYHRQPVPYTLIEQKGRSKSSIFAVVGTIRLECTYNTHLETVIR